MAVLLAFPFFIHGLLSRSHDQSLDPPNPPCPPATMVSPKSPSAVLRTANVNIIESGRFSSASWKPRRLELHPDVLIIIKVSDPNHSKPPLYSSHFCQLPSNKRTFLPLREITQLERSDLADYSLLLVLNHKKNYNLAFASDSELYDWQDDIYQRCPLGNYSAPFDFVHKAHIGGDTIGTFPVCRDIVFPYLVTNLLRTPAYCPSLQKLQVAAPHLGTSRPPLVHALHPVRLH